MKSDNVAIQFGNPNVPFLADYILHSARRKLPLVRHNMRRDAMGAVICGSGPSLLTDETLAFLREKEQTPGWLIFACKESIRMLREEQGIRVDYSVSMDPGANQTAKTYRDKLITYCLASSCNPVLYDWLLDYGCKVMVFHSACGVVNEVGLYKGLFGCGDTVVGGFTVVNRAVGVANYMGIPNLVLCGTDFGWREGSDYYAKGATGKHLVDVTMNDAGQVDGKTWWSRPDLLASAVSIAHLIKRGKLTVLGDSLANSLAKRDDEYLARVAAIKNISPLMTAPPKPPAEPA